MRLLLYIFLSSLLCFLFGCNKEKRLMNNLVGNWEIELSEKSVLRSDGTDSIYESISNSGYLTIYEDPNNPSKELYLQMKRKTELFYKKP